MNANNDNERRRAEPEPADGKTPSGPGKAKRPPEPGEGLPAAGPHDRPELTDPLKTPGAGTLPDPGDDDGTDSTAG